MLEAKGDYAQAEPLYRRALAIAEKAQGPEHPDTVTKVQNLGVMLRDAGKLNEAEELLSRALTIGEKIHEAKPIEFTPMLSAMGQLRLLQKRFEEAESLLERCLKILKAELDADNPRIKLVMERLGNARKKLHQ